MVDISHTLDFIIAPNFTFFVNTTVISGSTLLVCLPSVRRCVSCSVNCVKLFTLAVLTVELINSEN